MSAFLAPVTLVTLRGLNAGFFYASVLAQKTRFSTLKRHIWLLSVTRVTQLEFCHRAHSTNCMVKYTPMRATTTIFGAKRHRFGGKI